VIIALSLANEGIFEAQTTAEKDARGNKTSCRS
jgi:hypothetical protein